MMIDREFSVKCDKKGEAIGAERQVADELHELSVKKGVSNWKAYALVQISVEGERRVTARAAMSVPAETADLVVRSTDQQLELAFDFSRYNETHNVFISGKLDAMPIDGLLDPRSNRHSGTPFSIGAILSDSTRKSPDIFSPVFEESKSRFDAERKQHEQVINHIIHNSMWGSVGRAACWGFAGLGAAAACAGTFGAGCAVGAFAFAAAASVCNDQY